MTFAMADTFGSACVHGSLPGCSTSACLMPAGVHYSSLPLKVSPPAPPDVASLFDPKAKAAKVAADAKAAPDGKKPKPPSAKVRIHP